MTSSNTRSGLIPDLIKQTALRKMKEKQTLQIVYQATLAEQSQLLTSRMRGAETARSYLVGSSSFLSNLNHESQSMLASSQSWDPHDPFLDCLSEDRKKLSCQCKVRLVQNSESRREEGIIGALVPLDRRYDVIYRKDLSLAFLSPRLKAMNGIGLPHSYSGESGTVLAFKRLSSLPGMTTEEREFLPDQRGVIL
ncbi:hypothetical protein VNO80_27097 [Phaseolus coccineus]|uniref:Uncharacterized protein n=2 Tax=Phaseolus coccineus TaxID=3886 RepID=A0AAN9LJH6_PHACN